MAIDELDPSLGFATKWIETIANNYDQVDVVTLRKVSDIKFSENINIYGPNEKTGKFNKYLALLKQVKILTKENSYERCFSHMSPISIFV